MTVQVRGFKTAVSLYEEATYNTAPGSPAGFKLYYKTFEVMPTRKLIQSQTIRGDRTQAAPDSDNTDVAGNIAVEIGTENIGLMLKHLLGAVADTGTGPYVHTFTQDDLPVGLMIEKDNSADISGSGRVERFNGCRIASATFDIPQNGYPMITFAMKGAGYSLQTTLADPTPTDTGQSSLSAFNSALQEGGSDIASITKGSVTLNNDLDEQSGYTVGGAGIRTALDEGFLIVTGSITAQFRDTSLLTKALNSTDTNFLFTLSRGTGDGSAGNEFFSLKIEHMKYELSGIPVKGPKGITQDLNFLGFASGGNFVTAILKNQVVSY